MEKIFENDGGKLYFCESKIEQMRDQNDRGGIPTINTLLSDSMGCVDAPLYANDFYLLMSILNVDNIEDIISKKVIVVLRDTVAHAIGYQGMYIPLYFRDNSSRLLSESEICDLLGRFEITRLTIDGKEIMSYNISKSSKEKQFSK